MKLYRIQDKQGRGPWRPGLSAKWLSDEGPDLPPAIQEELPEFFRLVSAAHERGFHIGCAARGEGALSKWIQEGEMERLSEMGFFVVNATQCSVLAETEHQVLIGCKKPLRHLPKVKIEVTA